MQVPISAALHAVEAKLVDAEVLLLKAETHKDISDSLNPLLGELKRISFKKRSRIYHRPIDFALGRYTEYAGKDGL
jgi:hypothetical protein